MMMIMMMIMMCDGFSVSWNFSEIKFVSTSDITSLQSQYSANIILQPLIRLANITQTVYWFQICKGVKFVHINKDKTQTRTNIIQRRYKADHFPKHGHGQISLKDDKFTLSCRHINDRIPTRNMRIVNIDLPGNIW